MTPGEYERDIIRFADDLVPFNELGQPWRLVDHEREFLRRAFAFDADGRLPWDTIGYFCPKKSGKGLMNALGCTWWGMSQEPPNEIIILANDLEQAESRVFRTICGLFRHNPALAPSAEIQKGRILLSNGTIITAIASEYAGAAGSNHGMTSWDELWAYTSERSLRLWEELCPVPTRRNSIRLITSYAGFVGE